MKISARNQLKGAIVDVVKGATTSHIRIDISGGVIVTLRSPTRRSTNSSSPRASRPQP